jgi:hypothetical protein
MIQSFSFADDIVNAIPGTNAPSNGASSDYVDPQLTAAAPLKSFQNSAQATNDIW